MKANTIERFWELIEVGSERSCWIWSGPVNNKGYGVFSFRSRLNYAHRFAYSLAKGSVPKGVCVCHTCDNPLCCNPDHLWLGSRADNNKDCASKGRKPSGDAHWARRTPEKLPSGDRNGSRTKPHRKPVGDRNGSRTKPHRLQRGNKHWSRRNPEKCTRGLANGAAKLSDVEVAAVVRLCREGATQKEVAELYGISQQHVSRVIRGVRRGVNMIVC